LIARLAAAAPGLTFGTSVMLLPMLNPLDVAEQVATLDAITGGRIILGVGLGYREAELQGAGICRADLVARFEESVEILKRLWSDEPGTFRGTHFAIDGVALSPRPVQRPRPPLLIGGEADAAVRRAGRISDGWVVAPRVSEPQLSAKLALFREAAQAAGTAGTLALMRVFHVTNGPDEARQVEALARAHFFQKRSWGGERGLAEAGQAPDDVPALETVIGSPDACLAEIRRCLDTYRPDHLILLMGFKGMPEDVLRASIELAGQTVLPAIAGSRSRL
jgi:alkanesulfonate monooxygenase SsuD/methylene tetrahydromethanopterin reductase-like flavin-dependent oxidoreductase (luciferase family)